MIGRFWRRPENTFVEAKPTLFERIAHAWHVQHGPGKWFRLAWYVIASPFYLLAAFVVWVLSFRHADEDGVRARQLIHLLQGLPAVVATAGVLMVVSYIGLRQGELRSVYRAEAGTAFYADRMEAARLFYQRLFRLDGGSAETRFYLGLTLEKLGLNEEALQMIEGVADGESGGDPRANKWLAARMLTELKSLKDPKRLESTYKHLIAAERGLPGDPEVKLALAQYYLALGEVSKAVPKLAAAAAAKPELNYELSRVYLATGRRDSAQVAMERAEAYFRKKLEENPSDREMRLHLASCNANLGRLDEAVAILKEGRVRDPEGPYVQSIARLYVTAYDRVAIKQPPDYRTMLALLRDVLKLDPRSVDAAVRLAGFGEQPGSVSQAIGPPVDPETAKIAKEMLEEMLAAGEQPPAVHMALGLKAWRGEDLDTARFHFERAYELDPSLAGVANNLAWIISHQARPDLARALSIINPVADQFPDTPSFLDTRGEIYLKMGRWEEALHDFERALPTMRSNARLHESLATVYEKLNRESIAQRHREEAARLKNQKGNPVTPSP